MSRIAKITTIVLVCGITLSAAAYFLRDTAVAGVVMNKVNTYRLNQGLVGWWTFDGTDVNFQTNRVTDRSGQGNYGEMVNMSTSSSRVAGKVGQALRFDGVNDRVDLSAGLPTVNDFTISGWMKLETGATPGNHYALFKCGSCSSETRIMPHVNEGGYLTVNGTLSPSMNGLTVNEWAFIVVTRNGSTANYYRDGNLETSWSSGSTALDLAYSNIGADFLSYYVRGIIDDVRIYNRALSAQEVKLLYTSTAGSKMNTSKNVIPGSTLQSGLVGLWSFDGPDITDKVYDRSGQGNNGYFVGGATNTAKVAGKVGQALQFDGVDDEVITKDIDATEGSSYLTVAAWIKQDVAESATKVITKWGGGGNWEVESVINSQSCTLPLSIRFQLDWGISGCVNNVHQTGVWEHWVFVFDGTQSGDANRIKAYVNGTQRTVDTFGSIPATTNSNADPVEIGTGWTGSLDDIRVYNRALSAAEVKDLYTATVGTRINTSQNVVPGSTLQNGLTGLWSFNGLDMNFLTNKALDRSGNGRDAELQNMSTDTARISGKVGQAIAVDGVNDRVRTGVIMSSLITSTDSTISAWIFPQGTPVTKASACDLPGIVEDGNLINDGGYAGILRGIGTAQGSIDRIWVLNWDSSCDVVGVPYNNNEWIHVVQVHTGGNLYAYKNGDLVGSTPSGNTTSLNIPLNFGINYLGSDYYQGGLDEVRIYNRALSASEVKLLYNLGR